MKETLIYVCLTKRKFFRFKTWLQKLFKKIVATEIVMIDYLILS